MNPRWRVIFLSLPCRQQPTGASSISEGCSNKSVAAAQSTFIELTHFLLTYYAFIQSIWVSSSVGSARVSLLLLCCRCCVEELCVCVSVCVVTEHIYIYIYAAYSDLCRFTNTLIFCNTRSRRKICSYYCRVLE